MPTQLRSKCPRCGAIIRANETLVGKRVRCPSCKEQFELTSVQFSANTTSLEQAPQAQETIATGSSDTSRSPDLFPPSRGASKSSELGKLGRFELKELLGQGAFGRVYRAYDPQLDREVALKVPLFGSDDKHKIDRFITEAKAAARLHHANIVPIHDIGQADGRHYIVARFVRGETLYERIHKSPPDFRQAADWVRQLAEALAYAHSEGIVHRDIKPANVMLDDKGVPQIMDFGLAKRLNEDSGKTIDGTLLGTPDYMSPEQARGEVANIGPASDQYSLGVILYELITGKRPFQGSPTSVVAQVLTAQPPAPREVRSEIPADLARICQRAMSKQPATRYPSCAEMSSDIAKWLSGHETPKAPVVRAPQRTPPRRNKEQVFGRFVVVALMLAFGLVTTGALIWVLAKRGRATATKDEPGFSAATIVPLTLLNTVSYDETNPWVLNEGCTIYFSRFFGQEKSDDSNCAIYYRTRRDKQSPFSTPTLVFEGRQVAVTADELYAVVVPPQSGSALQERFRTAVSQPWGASRPIAILASQTSPDNPWLSGDGLNLVFQRNRNQATRDYPGRNTEFAICRRDARFHAWGAPQLLPLAPDSAVTGELTCPCLSDDLLTLFFCHGTGQDSGIWLAVRDAIDQPFGRHRPVIVNGQPLSGRSPRWLADQGELYFARRPASRNDTDLMVVENLRLPSSNVKSGASPLRRTPSTNRQSPDDAAWTSLIDGTTLSGWGKHGGNATFRADGEMIVGTTGSGNSSTYLTCGSYADFALEFEVLCDKPLNAGVLIRSHRDTSSAKSSQPNQWERVFGYECEITQAERGRSGNFYDYFRRNRLLDDLSQKPGAAKAYSDYEWNHFRIVAQGDHIRSWVNGVACADFRDPWDSIGFISLQIHGTGPGEGPFQVRWKNIRIRELKTGELAPPLTPAPHGVPSANDGFVTIFDGKSLAGWQTAKENLGSFQVRDGAIVANGPRCHLYYVGDGRPFKNFHFACEVMTKRNSNGGIYFHTKYQDTQNPTQGLECQINNSTPDQKTGSLYGIATVTPTPASDDEWFKCEVIVDGKHVVIKIRDKVTVDYVEPVSGAGRRLGEGTFALQAIVEGSTVYYRNIRVKRLP